MIEFNNPEITAEQLRAAYPQAADAVALMHKDLDEDFFGRARSRNRSIEEVLFVLHTSADEMIKDQIDNWQEYVVARPQMDTNDFRLYVGGRMGAC